MSVACPRINCFPIARTRAVWYVCKRRKQQQDKYISAQPAGNSSLQLTNKSYGNSSQAPTSYGNSSYRLTSTSPRPLSPTPSTRLTSPRQILATSSKRFTAKSTKRLIAKSSKRSTAKSSRRLTAKSSREMILSMKWGGDSFSRSDRNLRLSDPEYAALTDEIYEYYKCDGDEG